MHELCGSSTGPSSRPFQPRCVGGISVVSGLMIDSLIAGLIFVFVGVGFEEFTLFSGSFPHIKPSGARLSQRLALFSAPLYWNVPKSHLVGARLSLTMMSI